MSEQGYLIYYRNTLVLQILFSGMPAERKKAGTPADLRKSKRRAILTPADPDDSRVASPGTVDAVPRPSVVEVPDEPVIPESEHLAPIDVQHSEGYDESTISLAMDIAQALQNSRGSPKETLLLTAAQ